MFIPWRPQDITARNTDHRKPQACKKNMQKHGPLLQQDTIAGHIEECSFHDYRKFKIHVVNRIYDKSNEWLCRTPLQDTQISSKLQLQDTQMSNQVDFMTNSNHHSKSQNNQKHKPRLPQDTLQNIRTIMATAKCGHHNKSKT